MRNLSNLKKNVRKGQFFVLTAVAIVTILFFIGRWIGPSTQVDTSSIVQAEEFFTFDNIQQKSIDVIKGSENCDELDYNLQEYKNFIREFGRDKNYRISFEYSIPSCAATATVNIYLIITSEKITAQKSFIVSWP